MKLAAASLTFLSLLTASLAGQPGKGAVLPSLTTDEVVQAYQTNAAFVDEYLADKAVQVSGPVFGVLRTGGKAKEKDSTRYVVALQSKWGVPIYCYFDAKARKALAELRPGQQVVIRGTCQGKAPRLDEPGRLTLPGRGGEDPVAVRADAMAIALVNCELIPVAATAKAIEAKKEK